MMNWSSVAATWQKKIDNGNDYSQQNHYLEQMSTEHVHMHTQSTYRTSDSFGNAMLISILCANVIFDGKIELFITTKMSKLC